MVLRASPAGRKYANQRFASPADCLRSARPKTQKHKEQKMFGMRMRQDEYEYELNQLKAELKEAEEMAEETDEDRMIKINTIEGLEEDIDILNSIYEHGYNIYD